MKSFRIGDREVGLNHPPFIIAEMSGNHNQSLSKALEIVDAAAQCGVDAIKLQTYLPQTMTLNLQEGDFFISEPNSLWEGMSLYDLYEKAHTPWEWHSAIYERARALGLIVFSTPFDHSAVDFLEELETPCYKIASFENTDLSLLRKVAKTGKPVIMSLGMANLTELSQSVACLKESGCQELILLKCTSAYPAKASDINLKTLPHIQSLFDVPVGLSDHTQGISIALASIALGAQVIEKHFVLDRSEGGVDSAFSLEPHEMASLVKDSHDVWAALGGVSYGVTQGEGASRQFKRSLYIVEEMQAGEVLTTKNVRAIRPGYGLSPLELEKVLGLAVLQDIPKGTALKWSLLKQ